MELHDGLLSRDGWFLLDDTTSPLLTEGGRWYEPRPERSGPYQDGYLFAYGPDYVDALRDFRALAGPAPLLPRQAFGVWFSQYSFYSAIDYQRLVAEFRAHDVPLDVLVVDTDFKSPNPWNGWQWTPVFCPDPEGFLRWAHSKGLDVALNVHPSISTQDPGYAAADATAGGLDARRRPLRRLHRGRAGPVRGLGLGAARARRSPTSPCTSRSSGQGVDFWWLDWNSDASRADAPGLTPDAWINALYAAAPGRPRRVAGRRCRGSAPRCPDYGAAMPGIWAEHRNTIHFTGDAWDTLGDARLPEPVHRRRGRRDRPSRTSRTTSAAFTASKLPGDMYVRWVQLGAFQPILRLHSASRAPAAVGVRAGAPRRIASEFLRLRESLIPYTYTLARQAYDTGLPIVRGRCTSAGRGSAPPTGSTASTCTATRCSSRRSGPRVARKRVWFPPGEWVDIFTGQRHRGPKAKTVRAPLERMPVFARAGAIVPRQPDTSHAAQQQGDPLVLGVYGGDDGSFTLYEDAGDGLDYQGGALRAHALRLAPGRRLGLAGDRPGAGRLRACRPGGYELRITGVPRPRSVGVSGGGELRTGATPRDSRQLTIVTARVAGGAAPP